MPNENSHLKTQLFKFFLIVLFPVHVWSIYQVFNNFTWIQNRTNMGDAVGYGAYALGIAFLESVVVFLLLIPLFLVLRKFRGFDKAYALVGVIFIIGSAWLAFYLLRLYATGDEKFIWTAIQAFGIRLRYQYMALAGFAGLVALSVLVPVYLIEKAKNGVKVTINFLERIELLSYIYLGLDALGLLVILYRNITGALT